MKADESRTERASLQGEDDLCRVQPQVAARDPGMSAQAVFVTDLILPMELAHVCFER